MTFSEKLERAFNQQITLELASSYEYLALAGFFAAESLPGMARWMRLQSEEERSHALKFFDFVVDRNGVVELGAIDAPERVTGTVLAAFERALANERAVSESINRLYALVTEEQDFASIPLMDWFVNEQVEEEATVTQIIDDLRRVEDDSRALLMMDRELGARTGADEA